MLEAMDIRTHNDLVVQGSFHGIKIPMKHNQARLAQEQVLEDEAFDPAIAERAMREAQAEVRKRFNRG